MKNSTLENLINKYSNHSLQQNSVMFSKVSKVSRVNISESQLLKPTHEFYQIHESFVKSPKLSYDQNRGSLQKMKLDCEDYLYYIRQQLINKKMLFSQKQNKVVSILSQKLSLQQKKLREYLLEILDDIFREQQAYIQKQIQLRNYSKLDDIQSLSLEFEKVQKEVEKAIRGLKSQNFRNSISDVALNDFQRKIKKIQHDMEGYSNKIVETSKIYEFDRQRSGEIRQHLRNLCSVKKQMQRKPPDQENVPIQIDEPENQGIFCNMFS